MKSVKHDSPNKFNKKNGQVLKKLIKKYNFKKIRIAMKMYLCEKRG